MPSPLPLETQTIYAELLSHLLALDAGRSVGSVPGTFVTKRVAGKEHVYFQHSAPAGKTRQTYIGPSSRALERLVVRFAAEREALRADVERLEHLVSLARAGGLMRTDAPSVRVLRALADSGAFAAGAVVVGTHAFVALGNLLAVRWDAAAVRTHDVDVAGTRELGLAVDAAADLPGALARLEMGFLPVPPFDPRRPSTSFKVRGAALRVDVVTPGRSSDGPPVLVPALGTAAQPLRYLDYLIDAPEHAVVIDGKAVLVRVPQPARFALHKLLVAVARPAALQAKAQKDLLQAAQVLEVLLDDRPGDLRPAWNDLVGRGRRWGTAVRAGLAALAKRHAETHARLVAKLRL